MTEKGRKRKSGEEDKENKNSDEGQDAADKNFNSPSFLPACLCGSFETVLAPPKRDCLVFFFSIELLYYFAWYGTRGMKV